MGVLRYIIVSLVLIGVFGASCSTQQQRVYTPEEFKRLSCEEKVKFLSYYNEKMTSKSWYVEGFIDGKLGQLPLSIANAKFSIKAYITPKKAEITLFTKKFEDINAKIIDTPSETKICFVIWGNEKCSSVGNKNDKSSYFTIAKYWAYNTLTGIFPYSFDDVVNYSCDGDVVNVNLKDDFNLKFKYTKAQEVNIKGVYDGFKLNYKIKYEYDNNNIKSIKFSKTLGDRDVKMEIDYTKFEELKGKSKTSP